MGNTISALKTSSFHHRLKILLIVLVGDHKGSISAEHGLGFKKSKEIYYSRTPQAVEVMRKLKKLFDPKVRFTVYLKSISNRISSR